VTPSGVLVAIYFNIVEPPLSAGAVYDTLADVGRLENAVPIIGLSGMVVPMAGVILTLPTILMPGPIDKDM
jgi:hypothetical protein